MTIIFMFLIFSSRLSLGVQYGFRRNEKFLKSVIKCRAAQVGDVSLTEYLLLNCTGCDLLSYASASIITIYYYCFCPCSFFALTFALLTISRALRL